MDTLYPTFDICGLVSNKLGDDLFNADRFQGYVKNNPHTRRVHKHSFYHLVYFTKGKGEHVLDFETFPIKEGIIYFMRPGQVHTWRLEEEVDGYIVNFSPIFFEHLAIGWPLLDRFPFFNLFSESQVIELDAGVREKVVFLFENILSEIREESKPDLPAIMIAGYLLQLFVHVTRNIDRYQAVYSRNNYNSVLVRKFIGLIEENFRVLRLPKDYASMLYITSNHLNFICQEQVRMSAGELIRKRVLLEAKRLLVNFELTVSAIALELNFFDTSYFVKFFKKYTGFTPDAFRKQYYQKSGKSLNV